jgi:hypothetical protein
MREIIRKLKAEQKHKWRDEDCEGCFATFVEDFEDAVDRYEAGLDDSIMNSRACLRMSCMSTNETLQRQGIIKGLEKAKSMLGENSNE